MSQLESGEVDPSQVVEYQVYDTTVVTTNKQPGQYLHTTVFFIINLFGLGLLNVIKNTMSNVYTMYLSGTTTTTITTFIKVLHIYLHVFFIVVKG